MLRPEIVYIVDDDRRIRESIESFFLAHQIETQVFSSATEYLEERHDASSRCLLLDVRMPTQDGLDLQAVLNGESDTPPIIFMTGEGDVHSTVQAMKAGAFEFLTKPVDLSVLLDAVRRALQRDKKVRVRRRETVSLQQRFERLTAREREVLPLVIGGFLNKQAAGILGIAEVTLQVHRAQIMRKMEASSLPDLVRMSSRLGIRHAIEQEPSLHKTMSYGEGRIAIA